MAIKKDKDDNSGNGEPIHSDDLQGSTKMGTAVIAGVNFQTKPVTYYDVNGVAIFEGDIAIGMVKDIEEQTDAARNAVSADPMVAFGVSITGSRFRWPDCKVPYEVDPALPNQQRVTDAIAHWEANTPIRFPLRTAANQGQYPNYVRFTDAGGCWSMVGMQGGQQLISLGPNCSLGNAIHEIGHAVGLWHEQSREDRALFVTIMWQNIQSGMSAQFNQHITDGDDRGNYDYGSVMHYPRWAFSKNGQDTIVPTDPNVQIGQRNGLSAGDIAAVKEMYPSCGPVLKHPRNDLKIVLDRQTSFKKLFDDQRPFKKFRDDLPFDPSRTGTAGHPGTSQPFSMATPHHAAMAPQAAGSAADPYLAALEQQILELEAAIAEAHAQSARSQADIAKLQQSRDELVAMYTAALGGAS